MLSEVDKRMNAPKALALVPPRSAASLGQGSPIEPNLPRTGSRTGRSLRESKESELDAVNDLLIQRNWSEAMKRLLDIVSRYGKDDPVVYNNLGYASVHLGSKEHPGPYADAIKYYQQAIQIKNGPFATAQYNLGQAYRLLDATTYSKNAEAAFRKAISDAASSNTYCALAQNALGLVLKQRGDLNGAKDAYKMAIAQSGTDLPVAHYNLALVLEQSDKTRDAVFEYKAYLHLEPTGLNATKARHHLKLLGVE